MAPEVEEEVAEAAAEEVLLPVVAAPLDVPLRADAAEPEEEPEAEAAVAEDAAAEVEEVETCGKVKVVRFSVEVAQRAGSRTALAKSAEDSYVMQLKNCQKRRKKNEKVEEKRTWRKQGSSESKEGSYRRPNSPAGSRWWCYRRCRCRSVREEEKSA